MNNEEIKQKVEKAVENIGIAARLLERRKFELKQIMDSCPHTEKDSWTDNDGYGSFKVERCKLCGKQKDGGL